MRVTVGFRKVVGVPFGGFHIIGTIVFWGLCWGPPIFRNHQTKLVVLKMRRFVSGKIHPKP